MTFTMDVDDHPPTFTRKWFGDIFFGCWGLLVLMKIAREISGWNREGVLYWLVVGPLAVGWFWSGIAWLALVARDVRRSPGGVWNQARPWILACAGLVALVCGVLAVQMLLA
jgi:hypothetical protein